MVRQHPLRRRLTMLHSSEGQDPDTLLTEMRERLLSKWGDQISQIVLYGSRAKGEARPDSDFDLMVVYTDDVSRREARRRFRAALGDLRPLADLRVVTEEQYEAGQDVPGCLVEAVDRSGRVLHGR